MSAAQFTVTLTSGQIEALVVAVDHELMKLEEQKYELGFGSTHYDERGVYIRKQERLLRNARENLGQAQRKGKNSAQSS